MYRSEQINYICTKEKVEVGHFKVEEFKSNGKKISLKTKVYQYEKNLSCTCFFFVGKYLLSYRI